ncbi:MAG: hypothetical protein ILO36_03245, partial [Abditibacteriota bacterium]|nr:hypothetical protein [Abditibacteriota bacterium]
MDIIFVVAASFIVFIALLIIAIRCINISFNADMPSGRLLTRTELRRLYDDLNTNDFLTTPVLYINIFSHRLQTEDVYGQSSRVNVYLEECVKNAVHSAGFLGACAIDGHNFVLLASRDNKQLERFALEFAATHDLPTTLRRIINMLDIHIGQYTPVNSAVSFDDAVDHARRASLHARNIDSRFAIGRYELLQNVYDNEEMKKT